LTNWKAIAKAISILASDHRIAAMNAFATGSDDEWNHESDTAERWSTAARQARTAEARAGRKSNLTDGEALAEDRVDLVLRLLADPGKRSASEITEITEVLIDELSRATRIDEKQRADCIKNLKATQQEKSQ